MLITCFQLVTVYLSNIYVFTNYPDTFLNIRTGSEGSPNGTRRTTEYGRKDLWMSFKTGLKSLGSDRWWERKEGLSHSIGTYVPLASGDANVCLLF